MRRQPQVLCCERFAGHRHQHRLSKQHLAGIIQIHNNGLFNIHRVICRSPESLFHHAPIHPDVAACTPARCRQLNMMRRHLQDYSFKSMLRRGEGGPHQAPKPFENRAAAMTNAYLTNLRSSAGAVPPVDASAPSVPSQKVPPLRLQALQSSSAAYRSQSSRAPAAVSVVPAASSRSHASSGMRDHQGHSSQLARLSAEASQSARILGSLTDKIASTKAPRPRLPLLSSRRASGNASERRPLWSMAPSIPKLFASLVVNRGDTGLAAIDERLQSEQAQRDSDGPGRIGLEHWMEFCRETDAFSKLHVAPSDCIFAFRRSVEAAGSDESAVARKVGLVMNLEAFCGCIVILAELAGALPNSPKRSPHDGALHAVWDCDADTSKACSLLLLKLLTAAPGMAPPKAAPVAATVTAAAANSCPAAEPPRAAFAPSFPPISSSPRKSVRRESSSHKQYSTLVPFPPPSRKSSFAFTEDPESSVASSPSKSRPASFRSSALTSSPPVASRQRRARREQADGFARSSSSHHIVDVATGSEFLKWFQDKLTQIGSDGLAYPVRIVAVQVRQTSRDGARLHLTRFPSSIDRVFGSQKVPGLCP